MVKKLAAFVVISAVSLINFSAEARSRGHILPVEPIAPMCAYQSADTGEILVVHCFTGEIITPPIDVPLCPDKYLGNGAVFVRPCDGLQPVPNY